MYASSGEFAKKELSKISCKPLSLIMYMYEVLERGGLAASEGRPSCWGSPDVCGWGCNICLQMCLHLHGLLNLAAALHPTREL